MRQASQTQVLQNECKTFFSLSLWYPNEKGEALSVQGETGIEKRLLPSCFPPEEWKATGKCNHLPTVLNLKAHCLQLGPMSVTGHHCVCLLPHTASKSLRAWGDSTWQSWYADLTGFFSLLPTLKIPSCIITWFCWEKLQWKKGLLVYGIRGDKTGFSIPVPFVHAGRLLMAQR